MKMISLYRESTGEIVESTSLHLSPSIRSDEATEADWAAAAEAVSLAAGLPFVFGTALPNQRVLDGAFVNIIQAPPSAPLAPRIVTMRQARLALLAADKLDAVIAAIDSLPSPQKEAAYIEWEYAATVDRDSALMGMVATALSLDELALDALFAAAASFR